MVDDDLLSSMGDDGGSGSSGSSKKSKASKKKKKGSSSSKKSKGGSQQEAFRLTDESKLKPEEMELSEASTELAASTESAYSRDGGEGLEAYVRRQKAECKELHGDMVEKAKQYVDSTQKFTLIFHAMVWNFAQNRVGIYGVLKGEFGMSHSEAIGMANRIAAETGEKEMMEKLVKISTEKMID